MRAEDQFHIGIVTDDPDATVESLTSLFGYEWGPATGGPVTVALAGGDAGLHMDCRFSITVPRVEIVRSIPGTFWMPTAGAGIHHLGFWSDDVAADTAELEQHGYTVEAARSVGSVPFFAFLTSGNGFRVELVTRAAEAGMEKCWLPAG